MPEPNFRTMRRGEGMGRGRCAVAWRRSSVKPDLQCDAPHLRSAALMSDLTVCLHAARDAGHLLTTAVQNIESMLMRASSPLVEESISELAANGEWAELNDRFFRTLAFGTGGLRGRTIGKVVTAGERGTPQALDRPQFPCIGTNA